MKTYQPNRSAVAAAAAVALCLFSAPDFAEERDSQRQWQRPAYRQNDNVRRDSGRAQETDYRNPRRQNDDRSRANRDSRPAVAANGNQNESNQRRHTSNRPNEQSRPDRQQARVTNDQPRHQSGYSQSRQGSYVRPSGRWEYVGDKSNDSAGNERPSNRNGDQRVNTSAPHHDNGSYSNNGSYNAPQRNHDNRVYRAPEHSHTQHHAHDQRHYQPKYRLYKRHRYTYYRSPWYNTRYVTPIHHHYHAPGYKIYTLPANYVRVVVGGYPYYYFEGVYYKPYSSGYVVVSAPIGALVAALPIGFIAFNLAPYTYYYVNDTYYLWDEPRDGYVVVDKPPGSEKIIAQETQDRLIVYPNKGQSEEQQAKDRYECHRWAVKETGFDPTQQDIADGPTYETVSLRGGRDDYQRAMGACLEGRNYTVK